MSSTDRSGGPDQAGGEPDPAAAGSRARLAGLGWWPWAAGAALAGSQVLVLVAAPRHWRVVGAGLVVLVTLVAVGYAVFGGEQKR